MLLRKLIFLRIKCFPSHSTIETWNLGSCNNFKTKDEHTRQLSLYSIWNLHHFSFLSGTHIIHYKNSAIIKNYATVIVIDDGANSSKQMASLSMHEQEEPCTSNGIRNKWLGRVRCNEMKRVHGTIITLSRCRFRFEASIASLTILII